MSETLREARAGIVVGLALGDPGGDVGVGQARGDADGHLVNVPILSSSKYSRVSVATVERRGGNRSGGAFSVWKPNVKTSPSRCVSSKVSGRGPSVTGEPAVLLGDGGGPQ